MSALSGLKVLELTTGTVGPLVGMHLADFGADVVKLEPESGDPVRARAAFHMWNRGKRSLCLDWRTNAHGEVASLLERADVAIVSAVADLASHGYDLEAIRVANPGLVVVEVPPWHGPAPWLGGEEDAELLSAASGLAANQSSYSGGPVELVEPQVLYVQAAWAACATVSALIARHATRHGQEVSVTGVNAFAEFGPHLLVFEKGSEFPSRALGPGGPNPTYTTYCAKDGKWFFVGALPDKLRRRVFTLLEVDDLLDDPRIAQETDRVFLPENADWVRARMAAAFLLRDRADWLQALEQADVPVAEVARPEEWFEHDHLRAIGGHVTVSHPTEGVIHMPGSSISLSQTPAEPERTAPGLGGSTAVDVAWPAATQPETTRPDPSPGGPLAGYKVISLGAYVAGPYAARLLRELGAEVVKVEPAEGDPWRTHGFQVNDGMQGVALDIRDPGGREALRALISSADLVVDNFRPGVTTRLGLDHDQLTQLKPGIVTTSITGFGEVGPMHPRPGFDPVLGALSGMQALQGGDAEPVVLSLAVNDTGTAALAALGSTIALYHRLVTGSGQHVSCSLAATATYLQTGSLVRTSESVPPRSGGRDFRGRDAHAYYYDTSDGFVRIQCSPEELLRVVDTDLGVDEKQFAAAPLEAVADVLRVHTSVDVVAELDRAGVRSARVRTPRETALDPTLAAVEVSHEITLDDGYTYVTLGNLAQFSRRLSYGPLRPPGVGEHTVASLRDAGIPQEEVDRLLDAGVAIQGEPMVPRVLAQYR